MAVEYIVRYAGERINDFADLAILGGSCHLEAGAFGTLTLELPPSHPMARMGAFAKRDASKEVTFSERYGNGEEAELFRGWVTDSSLDADLVLTVECEGMLSYLARTCVRPYSATALTGLSSGTTVINSDPFEWLVEQHNLHAGQDMAFEVGYNPHARIATGSDDYKTTWDELNEKFCTGLDRFLYARSNDWGARVLDLLDGGAGEGTQAIVVGENVVEMDLDETSRDVVTAIVARGATDDEYESGSGNRVERREIGLEGADVGPIVGDCSTVTVDGDRAVNWDMVAAYGMKEEKRDYDATTPEDLARAAAADLNPRELEDRDVRAFDVTALDLHNLNPEVQPLRLLDWTEIFIRADGQVDGDAKGRLVFHGWLPCTMIDFDLGDPARSTYHFGDLPQTLTRQSALRLGMLRRGNGTLVRKAGATEWDTDRFWNRSDQVEDGYIAGDDELRQEIADTADQWSQHLDEQFDEYTQKWYDALDEESKESAQGREELLKHMDEIEGKWSDDLTAVDDKVDKNHRELLAGLRDVALTTQRTFFGVCHTRAGVSSKSVLSADLTKPGGEEFTLAKGAVVDVLFDYGDSGSGYTIDIAGTGVVPMATNGSRYAAWQDGEVLRLLYDGSVWQNCSNDIYGRSVTVGNPAQAHFYTDGNAAELRIGSNAYWHTGMDGMHVGLVSTYHVDIGSSSIAFQNGKNMLLTIEAGSSVALTADDGMTLKSNDNGARLLLSQAGAHLSCYNNSFGVVGNNYVTNGTYWVMRSIVVTVNDDEYYWLSPGDLGIVGVNGLSGYAFSVTNGDMNAKDFFVVGSEVRSNNLVVKFDRAINGRCRLNILGVPVSAVYHGN